MVRQTQPKHRPANHSSLMKLVEESANAPPGPSQLRRILPAGPAPTGPIRLPGTAGKLTKVPPKSIHVKAACETCRKRKIKCSGERPVCASCSKSKAECVYVSAPAETHTQALKRKYDQLQDETSPLQEIFHLISTLPEAEAYDIFRRLRLGGDSSSTLRYIRQGCILLQMSLAPNTRLRYTFPYQPEMPPYLVSQDNPYLQSMFWDSPFASVQPRMLTSAELESRENCHYLRPYHVAELLDPRLSQVKASPWTTVIADDGLFRDILSAYFIHEYPTYFTFQKDYFIDDMVHQRPRFCTPLLVNAVLAAGCHCYRGINDREKYWDPNGLGHRFLAQAEHLWSKVEITDETRLTTLQAALLLSFIFSHNGLDRDAHTFVKQAITLSDELGLFRRDKQAHIVSKTMRDARAYTAWSLYCWTSVSGYYFCREPLIASPPEIPVPDPDLDPGWFGEIMLRYPSGQAVIPMNHGHTFKAITALRHVLNEIASAAFGGANCGRASKQVLSWEQACLFRQRLDGLFQTLPDVLTPQRLVFPSHLKLHLEYHAAVYTMFIVLLVPGTESGPYPSPFSAFHRMNTTATEVATCAMNRYETIMRVYYLRHSFDFPDLFMSYHLTVLFRYTQEELKNTAVMPPGGDSDLVRKRWLSTLFLCLKGLYEQSRSAYVCTALYRVLLNKLGEQDRELLQKEVGIGDRPDERTGCHSSWPMPAIRRGEDPHGSSLDQQFQNLSLKKVSIKNILNAPDGESSGSFPKSAAPG